MAFTQAEYTMPPMVEESQWVGLPGGFTVTVDGNPPVEELVYAKIQFRVHPTSRPAAATIDSENGGISIADPASWLIVIPAQDLPLKAGDEDKIFYYDLETRDAAGKVKKYLFGTIQVKKTYTRGRNCA